MSYHQSRLRFQWYKCVESDDNVSKKQTMDITVAQDNSLIFIWCI